MTSGHITHEAGSENMRLARYLQYHKNTSYLHKEASFDVQREALTVLLVTLYVISL
jgi:hypothetical protein